MSDSTKEAIGHGDVLTGRSDGPLMHLNPPRDRVCRKSKSKSKSQITRTHHYHIQMDDHNHDIH